MCVGFAALRTTLQQECDNSGMTSRGRQQKRAGFVFRSRLDIRSSLQEEADNRLLPMERGAEQRGQSGNPGCGFPAAGGPKIDAAMPSGLDVCAALQKKLHNSDLAGLGGAEQGLSNVSVRSLAQEHTNFLQIATLSRILQGRGASGRERGHGNQQQPWEKYSHRT